MSHCQTNIGGLEKERFGILEILFGSGYYHVRLRRFWCHLGASPTVLRNPANFPVGKEIFKCPATHRDTDHRPTLTLLTSGRKDDREFDRASDHFSTAVRSWGDPARRLSGLSGCSNGFEAQLRDRGAVGARLMN